MLSSDSGQGDSISTPRSVSKRLFDSTKSLSKRNLFTPSLSSSRSRMIAEDRVASLLSGDESDLGPMSPLALTDGGESSEDSSPGRNFVSPLKTPENSPGFQKNWDRLRGSSSRNWSKIRSTNLSPFSELKSSTRAARSSPNRRIIERSPKSLPEKSRKIDKSETPEREIANLFNEIVPETPQKDSTDEYERIEETPDKKNSATSSIVSLRENIAPTINRRKIIAEIDEKSASERKIPKRHATDSIDTLSIKIPKIDDYSYPRARASLFPVKPDVSPKIEISASSFYSKSDKRGKSMSDLRDLMKSKKRQSLPIYTSERKNRPKKSRIGELNAGVRHGIKRPKPKKHVSRIEAFAKEDKTKKIGKIFDTDRMEKIIDQISETKKIDKISDTKKIIESRSPSPISDPNKRFFKTNRTIKNRNIATVTVNDKIKLRVSDGKIALNEIGKKNPRKRPRIEEISFDTDDLNVDEPNFDNSINRNNVDGILKVLEDDWADDDYDTMDILTSASPTRNVAENLKNFIMSPGSVLSDMTSSMNIRDNRINGNDTDYQRTEKKMFPVFSKGFSSGIDEETIGKKAPRGVKRSWQTSLKSGCGGAENQYQIDAGQKRFGATTCKECGIVYQLGEPEDENAHLNYHNSYKTLKFNGWKNERVIWTDPFTKSRIIKIEPTDPKQYWKKIEEVLNVVDRDLGLADMELSNYLDKNIYFYVREKTILGVMVAESIKKAHRMIPELLELDCCEDEETSAMCGVNVIWTALSNRRQHIATKLLDTLRASFYYGYIMSIDDIAFSIPTPTGKIFAEKYTKTRSFKVYS